MRETLWLPWEPVNRDGQPIVGSMDMETRQAIQRIGDETARHCHRTSREVQEQVYRLIGWDCKGAR